ncbi:sulfite exporter TauE/SafE family protein [Methanobrevibacter sp.]
MFKIIFTSTYIIYLIITGIIVGLASGLLGIGGGFIMVPLQFFALKSLGVSDDLAFKMSLGTSLACIIPTAISGAYTHNKKSHKDILKPGIMLGMFGIIGGFFGGWVSSIVPSDILKLIFSGLLIIISINMLIEKNEKDKAIITFNIFTYILIGLLVGFLAGLLGIGGGAFIIPILTILFGYKMVEAIGISTIFIPFSSIGGTISYIIAGYGINTFPYSIGYVNLMNFILIIIFSIPMAHFGAKISYKINEKELKILFAMFLIIIALKMSSILPF